MIRIHTPKLGYHAGNYQTVQVNPLSLLPNKLFMASFTLPKFTFAGSVIPTFATDNSFTAPFTTHRMAIIRIEKKRLCPVLDTTSFHE
jgi:hypothetical protein